MARQIIRLTESDLHRIIENTVRRIVKEVKFGGESFHGNDEADWLTMGNLRQNALDNSKNNIERDYNRQTRDRDYKNGMNLPNSNYRARNKASNAMVAASSPAAKYHAQRNLERLNRQGIDMTTKAKEKYRNVMNNLNPSKK